MRIYIQRKVENWMHFVRQLQNVNQREMNKFLFLYVFCFLIPFHLAFSVPLFFNGRSREGLVPGPLVNPLTSGYNNIGHKTIQQKIDNFDEDNDATFEQVIF